MGRAVPRCRDEDLRILHDGFEEVYVLFNNVSLWKDAPRFGEIPGPV